MNILAMAIPFFLLALIIELGIDRWRKTGYYRINDALNSLGAGVLSTTSGYFTRLVSALIWASVLQQFALLDLDPEMFSSSPSGIAMWLVALLAFDFCYYWAHRCGHEISVLWAAHAVHHQSEDYNLSTALRQTSSSFLFGWVFYLPLFLLGMPLEVFVTVNALDLIYQFWVHTQHIRNLGWLEKIFVTPSNHRVHHAQNEIYIDKNYGGILILWDRIFGTFQEEMQDVPVVFGVRKPLQTWNPFLANLQVYRYLWFDAVRTKRWSDKIGVFLGRTGWRPTDVQAQYPKQKFDIQEFRKFDPPISKSMTRYLLWQFTFMAAAVLWIGVLFATSGASAVLVPCLVLWSTLYTIGLLSEGRRYARRFEATRLLIVVPIGLLAIDLANDPASALYATAYILISLLLLRSAGAIERDAAN
jgi:alkylglycerol monooxygenase